MSRMIKILSIDGGGIRGIVPAMIAAEIERRTGLPIADTFDLIVGSSTGGILALGLAVPGDDGTPRYRAQDAVKLYEEKGALIFERNMWHRFQSAGSIRGSKYPTTGLNKVARMYFGDTRLRDTLTDVLVTSYELRRRQPWFFRSRKARSSGDCDFYLRDIIRATTAAPTYFDPARIDTEFPDGTHVLVDGSLLANNPALCAYVEAKNTYPDAEDFMIVSLGTGILTRPFPHEETYQWGLAGWSQHVMDLMFHAMTETVDYQLKRLLPLANDGRQHYYRFQFDLIGASDEMDDASAENIAGLKTIGHDLIQKYSDDIDAIVATLTAPQQKESPSWLPTGRASDIMKKLYRTLTQRDQQPA